MQLFHILCWLIFEFTKIPINFASLKEIHDDYVFEECFKKWIDVFEKNKADDTYGQCPYHVAKIMLTLNKFQKTDPDYSPRLTFKYESVYNELKRTFFTLKSESRWTHLSSWEMMINFAITRAMRRNKKVVIKFLDEALIQDNHLAIFGPVQKFSENPEFVNYHFKTADPIMSVSEEYEKIVKSTVLQVFSRMETVRFNKRESFDSSSRKGELTKAEIIDFAALIYQHFSGLVYFESERCMEFVLRILFTAAEFPKLSFDTYTEAVQEGEGREESEQIFKKLSERVKQTDIYAFTSNSNIYKDDDSLIYKVPCPYEGMLKNYTFVQDTPEKKLYFVRLMMISFMSVRNHLFTNERIDKFAVAIYDYHVLKSGHNIFSDLIVSLTSREPLEVLTELENKILAHYLPQSASFDDEYLSTLHMGRWISDGSLESIKFLVENCCKPIKIYFRLLSRFQSIVYFGRLEIFNIC